MSERLLIRLDAHGHLQWLAHDAGGRAAGSAQAGAPPAALLAKVRRVSVLVPAEDVLLARAPALARSRAQLVKAVPFALEDRLASPVEDLHFALASRADGEWIDVAILARERLRGWLDALAVQGIVPDALLPETLALPADRAVLLIEDTRALLRDGGQAFACEAGHVDAWLATAGIGPLEVFDFRAAPPLALRHPVARYRERQRDPLAFFAAQMGGEPAIDLLQGEFAPHHRQMPGRRLWQRAGLLAAAAVALGFVHAGLENWRLSRESARLDQTMREALGASFPKLANVAGDPPQLMRSEMQRLTGEGADGSLLTTLGKVAPILRGSTRVVVKGLEYRNATLDLVLRAPDVQALDAVRERLATLDGVKAEVTSAGNTGDGAIEGRVRITATDKS